MTGNKIENPSHAALYDLLENAAFGVIDTGNKRAHFANKIAANWLRAPNLHLAPITTKPITTKLSEFLEESRHRRVGNLKGKNNAIRVLVVDDQPNNQDILVRRAKRTRWGRRRSRIIKFSTRSAAILISILYINKISYRHLFIL